MTRSTIDLPITAEDQRIARYAAAAIVLSVAEAAIPMPLPGVKPGLGNIITLVVLARWGWKEAVWVVLLRVIAASLLLGFFLAPGFFLSLSGALVSLAVLSGAGVRSRGCCVWHGEWSCCRAPAEGVAAAGSVGGA